MKGFPSKTNAWGDGVDTLFLKLFSHLCLNSQHFHPLEVLKWGKKSPLPLNLSSFHAQQSLTDKMAFREWRKQLFHPSCKQCRATVHLTRKYRVSLKSDTKMQCRFEENNSWKKYEREVFLFHISVSVTLKFHHHRKKKKKRAFLYFSKQWEQIWSCGD